MIIIETNKQTGLKREIIELFFKLYLKLSSIGERENYTNKVYDHLGLIDTLGFKSDKTLLTSHYSDEFNSEFSIHLFGHKFSYIDSFTKSIVIQKDK